MASPLPPRLLVFNQYYWPGVEATAHLLTDLCEGLAGTFDVRVVTGVLNEHEDEPRSITRNGVEIVRVLSTSFDRTGLAARARTTSPTSAARCRRASSRSGPTSSSA